MMPLTGWMVLNSPYKEGCAVQCNDTLVLWPLWHIYVQPLFHLRVEWNSTWWFQYSCWWPSPFLQMADEGKGQLLITVVRNGTEVFFLSKLFTIVLLLNVSLQEWEVIVFTLVTFIPSPAQKWLLLSSCSCQTSLGVRTTDVPGSVGGHLACAGLLVPIPIKEKKQSLSK